LSGIERLNTLATRINEEHRRCEAAFRSGVEHALKAGELQKPRIASHTALGELGLPMTLRVQLVPRKHI